MESRSEAYTLADWQKEKFHQQSEEKALAILAQPKVAAFCRAVLASASPSRYFLHSLCSSFYTDENGLSLRAVKEFKREKLASWLLVLNHTVAPDPFQLMWFIQSKCPFLFEHPLFASKLDLILRVENFRLKVDTVEKIRQLAAAKYPRARPSLALQLLTEDYPEHVEPLVLPELSACLVEVLPRQMSRDIINTVILPYLRFVPLDPGFFSDACLLFAIAESSLKSAVSHRFQMARVYLDSGILLEGAILEVDGTPEKEMVENIILRLRRAKDRGQINVSESERYHQSVSSIKAEMREAKEADVIILKGKKLTQIVAGSPRGIRSLAQQAIEAQVISWGEAKDICLFATHIEIVRSGADMHYGALQERLKPVQKYAESSYASPEAREMAKKLLSLTANMSYCSPPQIGLSPTRLQSITAALLATAKKKIDPIFLNAIQDVNGHPVDEEIFKSGKALHHIDFQKRLAALKAYTAEGWLLSKKSAGQCVAIRIVKALEGVCIKNAADYVNLSQERIENIAQFIIEEARSPLLLEGAVNEVLGILIPGRSPKQIISAL